MLKNTDVTSEPVEVNIFLEKLAREGDIYLALESNAVKTYIW